jgi:hypothetical protein
MKLVYPWTYCNELSIILAKELPRITVGLTELEAVTDGAEDVRSSGWWWSSWAQPLTPLSQFLISQSPSLQSHITRRYC